MNLLAHHRVAPALDVLTDHYQALWRLPAMRLVDEIRGLQADLDLLPFAWVYYGLMGHRQLGVTVDHGFALSNPALVSAPFKNYSLAPMARSGHAREQGLPDFLTQRRRKR